MLRKLKESLSNLPMTLLLSPVVVLSATLAKQQCPLAIGDWWKKRGSKLIKVSKNSFKL
jgi:hypothetical protein